MPEAPPSFLNAVQPNSIVSDVGKSAKIVDVVRRRGGFFWGIVAGVVLSIFGAWLLAYLTHQQAMR